MVKFIEKIIGFGERQGEIEKKVADFIIEILKQNGIEYYLHKFETEIPEIKKSILMADSKLIDSKATSFVSGKIVEKGSLVSSLIPSRFLLDYQNINFNPACDAISQSNFYFSPSLAIAKKDLVSIMNADNIFAEVLVERKKHESKNILVGNNKNPYNIIFAHYDSVSIGATDNASGVAVVMNTVLSNNELLEKNLFVFSGNEELSYDKPTYWGHGFRAFEDSYFELLKNARGIFVIDCVGNGKTVLTNNLDIGQLAFPIKNKTILTDKIFIMHSDIEKLFKVYHSELDDLSQLGEKDLAEAYDLLIGELK